MGQHDGQSVYKSQEETTGPFAVAGGIHFLWFSQEHDMWFLTTVPVDDPSSNDAWELASVKMSCTKDWSQCWCPWNSVDQSKLKVGTLDEFYQQQVATLSRKLTLWQSWWHADGKNEFVEEPPSAAPPPKKAKTAAPPSMPQPPWHNAYPSLMPPPPVPAGVASASTAAAPMASSPAVPKGSEQPTVYTGWKPKMCALLCAIQMNLTQRTQHLVRKLLVCKYIPQCFALILYYIVDVVVICPTGYLSQLRFSENEQMSGWLAQHREVMERFGRDPMYDY